MKVLIWRNFGCNAKLKLVLDIINQNSEQDQLVVVVSALSKVTDLLQLAAAKAASNDESFRDIVAEIEKKHLETLKDLIPVSEQSSLLSHVKRIINHLETLLDGCFIRRLVSKTSDTILILEKCFRSIIARRSATRKNVVYKDRRD